MPSYVNCKMSCNAWNGYFASAYDHDGPATLNEWLKKHSVRIWRGRQLRRIALREKARIGREEQAAYAGSGMVITWWLTEG
jgi:hypothetical protein